ncbi:hypothetical protein GOBAR_DD27079 [Gossypium barbadense]|nr:hypothetical protein GOBAR_DD27079 [Gossypium barbadense]
MILPIICTVEEEIAVRVSLSNTDGVDLDECGEPDDQQVKGFSVVRRSLSNKNSYVANYACENNVFREKFHAHKLVLAASSLVFEAEFPDRMEEDDNNIVVTDMEPKVFKALLHFIDRDYLIDDEEFVGTSSSSMPSASDALAAKL